MKHNRLIALIVVSMLTASLCLTILPQSSLLSPVKAQHFIPFYSTQYSDGTLASPNSPLETWYTWINASGTQIINYALYTTPDYPYPIPISSLIGQHLHLADGSDIFVASALTGMEVYKDTGGAVPQPNQILYYMYSNMSDSYNTIPIQKVTVDGIDHYQWGFTYENVYAYLQNFTVQSGVDVRFKLDHLTLSYDFSVNGTVSNLKTGFDIGQVSDVQTYNPAQGNYVDSGFSFDGLSLSLLYATVTYSSTSYSTYVNGQPYDSATAQTPVEAATTAQIGVQNATAYDFIFGGNYTLTQGNSTQSAQATVGTYEAQAEAASASSLPYASYGSTISGLGFFADELNLTTLFGGSWPALTTSYSSCPLIYRICFPTWSGQQITYDPLYVGYLAGAKGTPVSAPEFPAVAVIATALVTASALVIIIRRKQRQSAVS